MHRTATSLFHCNKMRLILHKNQFPNSFTFKQRLHICSYSYLLECSVQTPYDLQWGIRKLQIFWFTSRNTMFQICSLQRTECKIKVLSTSNVFYLYFFFSINSSFVKFNVNFLSKVNSQQKNTISFLIHVHVHRYNFFFIYVNIHTLMNLLSIYTHELT